MTCNYTSGINDDISRLSSLSDTTGTLESYSYLGLGTVVIRSHPQPANKLASPRRQPGISTWRAPGVSRGFALHGNNDSSSPRRQPGKVRIVNQRPHDGRNHRVTNTVGTTTTNLYYSNQWQVLEEQVSGSVANRYVWSPVYVNAMALRDRDSDGNGTLDERLWPTEDANWDVMALVNPSGNVVERYTYDPYGVQTVYDASYTVRSGGSIYSAIYGFQGMWRDSISGLSAADERWYSAAIERWVSVDLIRYNSGDTQLYRFEENESIVGADPTGMQDLPDIATSHDNRDYIAPPPTPVLTATSFSDLVGGQRIVVVGAVPVTLTSFPLFSIPFQPLGFESGTYSYPILGGNANGSYTITPGRGLELGFGKATTDHPELFFPIRESHEHEPPPLSATAPNPYGPGRYPLAEVSAKLCERARVSVEATFERLGYYDKEFSIGGKIIIRDPLRKWNPR